MAGGASRRESLSALVRRRLVAAQAGIVGGVVLEADSLDAVDDADVAGAALAGEDGVGAGERAGAVGKLLFQHSVGAQPGDGSDDHHQAADELPAAIRRHGLEVIQVVAGAEAFRCALACHISG